MKNCPYYLSKLEIYERELSWIKGIDKIQAQILCPMQFLRKVYGSRNKRGFVITPELLHYAFRLSLLSCILL